MALRPILKYPDPRLREAAKPVSEITPEILKLVEDMAETMYDAPGCGLAANQIGVGLVCLRSRFSTKTTTSTASS
jgi:peptide deformylase